MPRIYPNIIITGTPGVGKTTTAEQLVALSDSSLPLRHLSVNDVAQKHDLYESYDEELETHVVDEDRLLDKLDELIDNGAGNGGWVIDWHVCDILPERWADLVVVLRCADTGVFYERLAKRKYSGRKLDENVDAEIFGTIADEAKEAWPTEGQVVELSSVDAEDVESNAERIWTWCRQWVEDNAASKEES